ncbi:hypothetical protein Hanom_Chr16g01494031 [Helianthus anomalus]
MNGVAASFPKASSQSLIWVKSGCKFDCNLTSSSSYAFRIVSACIIFSCNFSISTFNWSISFSITSFS